MKDKCTFKNMAPIALLLILSPIVKAAINHDDIDISTTFNVPVPFINTGGLYVIGNGSIVGDLYDASSLHFGISKDDVLDPTNFTATANIGGITKVQIHEDSSFSSEFYVSGITESFKIDENASATISGVLSTSGVIENKGTLTFTSTAFANTPNIINVGAINIANSYNFPSNFENSGDIYVYGDAVVYGSLSNGNSLNIGIDSAGNLDANTFNVYNSTPSLKNINVNTGSDLLVTYSGIFEYNGNIAGSGRLTNNGTLTLADGGSFNAAELNNSGKLNIKGSFAFPNNFTNSGSVYVSGMAATITGEIKDGTSLNFGKDSQDTMDAVALTYAGNVTSVPSVNIFAGRLTTANSSVFSNIGSMTIDEKATAMFGGTYEGTGDITNYGNLYLRNEFTANNILNQSGGNLHLETAGSIVAANISNQATANLNINTDVNMSGKSIINYGTIKVNGANTLTLADYSSTGSNIFSIYAEDDFDSLNIIGNANLNGSNIIINSDFMGVGDKIYDWEVFKASQIITDANTKITFPPCSMLRCWHQEITEDTISVGFKRISFETAASESQAKVAASLEELVAIPDQNCKMLVERVSACNNASEWNSNIENLIPAAKTSAQHITTQNATLNKAEMRIASVREQAPTTSEGVAFGDIKSNSSMWLAGFGSIANQKTTSAIAGYKAKVAGGLLGYDAFYDDAGVVGAALGWSNSNIDDQTANNSNTRILGYHALLYGTFNINHSNFFEWLVTGIDNKNVGSRVANVSNTNFNVNYNYHSLQGGFRFNLGQYINFDNWRYSQIETIRYTMLQQPGYEETGSPAALQVASQGLGNILTLGVGARASSVNKDRWLASTRELRIMGTYDAITTDNVTTASFIVGGSDFTISNSASRWALQLGASYGFAIVNHMQLEFSYDFELRDKYTDNSGEIKLRYLF